MFLSSLDSRFLFIGMTPVATISACSAVALIAVSLVTKPPSETTLQDDCEPEPAKWVPQAAEPSTSRA